MTYTVHYKLDKDDTWTIKAPKTSTLGELLDIINKKHHLKLITLYSKVNNSHLDLTDQLSDYYTDDEVFYVSESDVIEPIDFENKGSSPKSKDLTHSLSKSRSKGSTKSSTKEYPSIPDPKYPSIPKAMIKKSSENSILKTQIKGFHADFKTKQVENDIQPDEYYIYSTQNYQSMTTPKKITLPKESNYSSTEKSIRKLLKISKDYQIHIFLPAGIPFAKKCRISGKKTDNTIGHFFNTFEEANHVLYVVITRPIDDSILDRSFSEICNVSDDTMKLLTCPICECPNVSYSRMACLLGTFYYRGLRTFDFIISVARCTGFAPLVSFLSSMLYHEPITGLMLATVSASLHSLFSKLLPKSIEAKDVFSKCLECACYIVHIEEAYQEKKKGKNGATTASDDPIVPVEIEKEKDEEEIADYLHNCYFSGNFYKYSPDIDESNDFETVILEKVPTFKIIENIFNNFASYRPIPPLSTLQVNVTCIIQYVKGQTLLFIGVYDAEDDEETINVIDPFVGKIQKANIMRLSEDVSKYSEDTAPLIESNEVEDLIVILFDVSGSMLSLYDAKVMASRRKYDKSHSPPKAVVGDTDRFSIASQYLISFLNRSFGYKLPQLISLVSFNNKIKVECNFTPLGPKIESAAAKMKMGGRSCVWDAIDFAINQLNDFNKDKKYPNAKPRILIFSDGIDSGSKEKKEDVCQRAINSHITVDSVIVSLVDECESLCKFSHLTGGYSLRSENIHAVNSIFEKEAFLSLKLRTTSVIPADEITEEVFDEAGGLFDEDVDNYDFITKTHLVKLSTPNFVMSRAKKSKDPPERRQLRLLRELKKFQLANDKTMKLYVNSNDINNWKVYLLGPEGTFYSDHWWYLSITFSEAYPLQPPLFRFISIPYHINISEDGRVCASFLYKMYKSSFSVYELVNKVKDLMKNPEEKFPIQAYKRMLYFHDKNEYNNQVEESSENMPDEIKPYLAGCRVDDDSKFKVKKNDFEDEDDDEETFEDIIKKYDIGHDNTAFQGSMFVLIDEPGEDDLL